MQKLINKKLPFFLLKASSGLSLCIGALNKPLVLFVQPVISDNSTIINGNFKEDERKINCNKQIKSFRDIYTRIDKNNIEVFGVNTHPVNFQLNSKFRHGLPFDMLSDVSLVLKQELGLETFFINNKEYYKHITLIISKEGIIKKVFYPIKQPSLNPLQVINWINQHKI